MSASRKVGRNPCTRAVETPLASRIQVAAWSINCDDDRFLVALAKSKCVITNLVSTDDNLRGWKEFAVPTKRDDQLIALHINAYQKCHLMSLKSGVLIRLGTSPVSQPSRPASP